MASDHHDDKYLYRPTVRPRLTVAEVAELAKAGVKVELENVDLVPAPPRDFWNNDHHLMVALVQRINQAFPLDHTRMRHRFDYMSVSRMRDKKIAVMVVTASGNAALIEDEEKMFPSDTFIAKLILMIETEEKSSNGANSANSEAPQTGIQTGAYASPNRAPAYAPPGLQQNDFRLGGKRVPNSP